MSTTNRKAGLLLGAAFLLLWQQCAALIPHVRDGDDGRLPRDLIPYHYDIDLTPDFYQSGPPFTFTGRVVIWFECVTAGLVATVNIDPYMTVLNVSLAAAPDSPIRPPSPGLVLWEVNRDAEFLNVMAINDFEPNARYTLTVDFSNVIYSSDYGDYGLYYDYYTSSVDGTTKYILATQLQDIAARSVFPCFDEPDLKATFNVTVAYQLPFTALSNMPVIRTDVRPGRWLANVYQQSPLMSTYQVCVCIGELQSIETNWAGYTNYPITIYFRPDMAGQMEFPANITPPIVAWLESETGIPYNLPKLDQIALPNKGGAMENWGLITYGEQYFASNPETRGAYGAHYAGSFIAHEVAHQWYGNLVTMKWWDDAWLNEGFASYYDYLPMASIGWDGRAAAQRDRQDFMFADQKNITVPVRQVIDTPWDAAYAFSSATYIKGGAMVTMLEAILGSSNFRTAMTTYLTDNQYSSTTTDDLWRYLTDESINAGYPVDIKAVMDPWLNQIGLPVLTVVRQADGTAVVTQDVFLHPPNQLSPPSPYGYKWTTPLTVVTADSTEAEWDGRPTHWMTNTSDTLVLQDLPTDLDQWVLVNPKQRYYYRVNYDDRNLAAIANQLNTDHTRFDDLSRAQIVDDTFTLARATYLLETSAMEMTRYLSSETSFNPWYSTIYHLSVSSRMLSSFDWFASFTSYYASKVLPVYNSLGWEYSSNEHPDVQMLRQEIVALACDFGSADCLEKARNEYSTYLANPDVNSINPNNLQTVLCVGVTEGTTADWGMVFTQYQNRRTSQMFEERYAYVCALSCTTDNDLLDRLLTYIVGGVQIAPRDQYRASLCMTASQNGLQKMLDYLSNSWANVPPGMNKWSLLRYITNRIGDQAGLDKLNAHIAINGPQSESQRSAYTHMVLTVEQNINWMTINQNSLKAWFETNAPTDTPYRMEQPLPASVVDSIVFFNPEERQLQKTRNIQRKRKFRGGA